MLVTKALLLPLRFRTDKLSQDVTHLAFVPLAQEAARRSSTGSLALRESEASATKRVAWNGNHLHFDQIFTKIPLTNLIFNTMK